MPDNPLISVIIPVYNVEEYLPDCLNSLLESTYQNLEIICVNDGSPDNSAAILEQYAAKDPRFKVLNKENGGQASARNKGLEAASGKYVFFLDSDDWVSADCLGELLRTAEESGADLACIEQITVWHSPEKIETEKMISGHRPGVHPINNDVLKQMWVVPWGKLFRRQQLLDMEARFPEGYIYEDEYLHYFVTTQLKKAAISPRGTVFYRIRETSTMNSGKLRSGNDNLMIFSKIYDYYKKFSLEGKFDVPVRILAAGFNHNENSEAYFGRVKRLVNDLGVTDQELSVHPLMKKIRKMSSYADYQKAEKADEKRRNRKKLGKSLLRFKIGKKTHIVLLGLTLIHYAKGEPMVICGIKCGETKLP